MAMRLRARHDVVKRGRWASEATLKNYDKEGRLQEVMARAPRGLAAYAEQVRASFPRWWRERAAPSFKTQ